MLRQYELVERVKTYDPEADEDLLNRAYVFSMRAHGSQTRASGDPYFSHPIEVAGILTELRLDDETIATAILHDTIEDTLTTHDEIERLFGGNVARLVDGVTKLSRIEAQSENERAAENLRKFLLAMSDDIRVLLVKLADRLHNMRTLDFIPSVEKRRRIARETMDIYAPLAGRIGMYEFMEELQGLAFRTLEPEAYASITKRLEQLRVGGGDTMKRIAGGLQVLLASQGIDAEVTGREKRPYSIWRKMQERHIAFEQIADVLAFRVIVPDVEVCYQALGAIHRRWPMMPGRFKDFISTPRRNGYRSLHTTVLHRERMRVEIQIRTPQMHKEAELGLAAHWAYKEGGDDATPQQQHPWLRDLLEILEHASSPEELLEHARLAMYHDQVFCFSPKGELIQLPKGSTPVDFAYAVHTDLGDTCVGAKVNGRVVPLRTQLGNGDQVEILRSSAQKPDPRWESFAVTGKARSAVRRFIRQKERGEQAALGAQIFDQLLARIEVPLGEDAVRQALARLRVPDQQALNVALGRQTIDDEAVLEALMPGSSKAKGTAKRRTRTKSKPKAISIEGLTPGVAMHLAECCNPIPGDRIVGVRHPGRGIIVHVIDCAKLEQESGEWLDLRWGDDSALAIARLKAAVVNEPGALATVARILADHGANIVNMRMAHRDMSFHTYLIDLEVDNLEHLTNIKASLRAAQAITSVDRVRA